MSSIEEQSIRDFLRRVAEAERRVARLSEVSGGMDVETLLTIVLEFMTDEQYETLIRMMSKRSVVT